MKRQTQFRLMLKLAGVLLIGLTIDSVLYDILQMIQWQMDDGGFDGGLSVASDPKQTLLLGYSLLTTLAPMLAGLYLLFGGNWLVQRIVPNNRPFCEHCGYRLTGARHERCPECGVSVAADALLGVESIDSGEPED